MWWNILKETKQTSRQVGSLNWDDEEIPEEDDGPCVKKLLEYQKKLKGLASRYNSILPTNAGFLTNMPQLPTEKIACKALELLERVHEAPNEFYANNDNDGMNDEDRTLSHFDIDGADIFINYMAYESSDSNKLHRACLLNVYYSNAGRTLASYGTNGKDITLGCIIAAKEEDIPKEWDWR